MPNWLINSYWSAFVLWNIRHEAKAPYWPLEKLLSVQRRRIRSIVAHAYRYVPFYRDEMQKAGLRPQQFHTAEDLERLPLLTKEALLAAPERFRSSHPAAMSGLTLQSSGTSGQAVHIAHDKAALFLALAHGHRQRIAMAPFLGRTTGYKEAGFARPGAVSVQLRHFYEAHSWTPRRVDLARTYLSASAPFSENLAKLNEFHPEVVRGYGSYLGPFFRWVHEQRAELRRPKVIVYGADRMTDADRTLIEQEMGIHVWSSYQATEALRIAFQCELRQGFHISLDQVAVRVIDQHGNRVEPGGTGELILSNITNRATVLLNFRLGDMVTLGKTPCPCGRTLPTIDRIEGRQEDSVRMPDGSIVHSLAILGTLQPIPGVRQVQLVQEDLRTFLLRVVCSPNAGWPAVSGRVEMALYQLLGRDANLRVLHVDRIPAEPGGKVRAVVSHCTR